MPDDDAGFFRSLRGLATDWVQAKRRSLAPTNPQTNVDSRGASTAYHFDGQDLSFEDLRDIKDIREDGGQVAQLMTSKALLNFGEGAEFAIEDEQDDEQLVDGDAMTLSEWLDAAFPHLDMLVLDLGEDALWYPYAVGETLETRAGAFKRALPADPWTMLPETGASGDIRRWHQRVETDAGIKEQMLAADDIWHIVLNKASARDEIGISEVLRSQDEIQAFKQNEQAINQAIELHGFPQRHVKVGKEDGAPVRDNDLRRVRTIFDPKSTDANTAYFTGQDVDVETLEAHQFDYTAIHEMDMRNLTTALGLPLEAGNVGSDGLGSGKPAELRFALLKLAIKANQRAFGVQFVEKVVRPVVREYSPFDADADITLRIDDPLEDIGEVADLINSVGDYMTNAEAKRRLDLPEPEDDDIAEAYRSPADVEAAEEGDGAAGAGGGAGFFGGRREMQTPEGVPDDAVGISDRSEAPEDAQIVEGPGGGLYYVPGGDGGEGRDGEPLGDIRGGDPPDSVDLSDEVDSQSLEDAGITSGSNHADMRIAQLDDGSEVFVRENVDDFTADRIAAGHAVYEQAGVPVPDQHIDDDGTLAKEAINGETLRQGGGENADRESVIDAYAASIITGDTDMHGGNMIVRDDGTVMPVDMAGSGAPVDDPADKEGKIMNYIDMMDMDIEFDEIADRAEEMAQDIDPDDLPDTVATDNISDNVEAIA